MDPQAAVDLRAVVSRLCNRSAPGRTEATVQSDIRLLLIASGLNISEDDILDVTLEAPLGDRRRIDIEIGRTAIEVKRSLASAASLEDAVTQLSGYVSERGRQLDQRYVGIVTDGRNWHLFHSVEDSLRPISAYGVDPASPEPEPLIAWLAAVLVTQKQVAPTRQAISCRLGADSPGHRLEHATLRAIYDANRENPEVQVKRELWTKLLTTALGTQFGSDEDDLFVEHTLLVATAECVAHAALNYSITHLAPSDLLRGELFAQQSQIHGVVDHDFFDWPLDCGAVGTMWASALARRLHQFDWSSVSHDAMKTIYESIIGVETRRRLGEYYTPDFLAESIVEEVVTEPLEMSVLDPSCGSGTFLFHAIRRYLAAADDAGIANGEAVAGVAKKICGIDVHPVAVTLARVTYLLAIGTERLAAPDRGPLRIPVFLGDALQWGQRGDIFASETLNVSTGDGAHLFADQLRFPQALLNDAERFDALVADLAEMAATREPSSRPAVFASITAKHKLSEQQAVTVRATFEAMCRLHDDRRDHIWGYYVRNLARPAWMALPENRCQVLVGNPPWLAYRHMTEAMKATFREMATRRVDHERHVHEAAAGAHIGEVREPQPIRRRHAEVPLHQVRGPVVVGPRGGGRRRPAPPGPFEAETAHQPFHGAAGDPDRLDLVEVLPHLHRAVGVVVVAMHPGDHLAQEPVTSASRRRRPGLRGVIGGRGDPDAVLGEHSADRLDPEPVPVSVDERHYDWDWRSSSGPSSRRAVLGPRRTTCVRHAGRSPHAVTVRRGYLPLFGPDQSLPNPGRFLRSGSRDNVQVTWDTPWDLSRISHTFFPRTACVAFGTRSAEHLAMPTQVERWSGPLRDPSQPWSVVRRSLTRTPASNDSDAASSSISPYKALFRNGANVYPRLLTTIQSGEEPPLGSGSGRRAVRSDRGVYAKGEWKKLPDLHGVVEHEFVYPLLMGESVLPFLQRSPAEALLPFHGARMLTDAEVDTFDGLARWWQQVRALWSEHGGEPRDLRDSLDHYGKLTSQFPLASQRVVCAVSGMHVTACRVLTDDALVEHQLDWAPVTSVKEGTYLCAVLNSATVTTAVEPYMVSGKGGGRHIGSHLWKLPIPIYSEEDHLHRQLATLGARAEQFVADLDIPEMRAHGAMRRRIRASLATDEVGREIEGAVSELLAAARPE